jgi:hypothetical protein
MKRNLERLLPVAIALLGMAAAVWFLGWSLPMLVLVAMSWIGFAAVTYSDGELELSGRKNPWGFAWAIGNLVLSSFIAELNWPLGAAVSVVSTTALLLWASRVRFTLRALFLVVTVACALLAALLATLPRTVSLQALRAVQPNMARAEVQELLGPPEARWAIRGSQQSHWDYTSGQLGEWTCTVSFDSAGRVVDKRYKHWEKPATEP